MSMKIIDFAPISDQQLNNDALLWVVGDSTGLLYKPNIGQLRSLARVFNDGSYQSEVLFDSDRAVLQSAALDGSADFTALVISHDTVVFDRSIAGVFQGGLSIPNWGVGNKYFPLSVNGVFADNTGNIELSGGGDSPSRFGLEDNTGVFNRLIDMSNFSFTFKNLNGLEITNNNGRLVRFDYMTSDADSGLLLLYQVDGTANVSVMVNGFSYQQGANTLTLIAPTVADSLGVTMPISVNGVFADNAGNIVLGGGGGSQGFEQVIDTNPDLTKDNTVNLNGFNFILHSTGLAYGLTINQENSNSRMHLTAGDLTMYGDGGLAANMNPYVGLSSSQGAMSTSLLPDKLSFTPDGGSNRFEVKFPYVNTLQFFPISVNGVHADNFGNIALSFSALMAATASELVDAADDVEAAAKGVELNHPYRAGNDLRVRIS